MNSEDKEMIIFPPEEIRKYITLDENGQWTYADSMPEKLVPKFEEFKKNIDEAVQYQKIVQ